MIVLLTLRRAMSSIFVRYSFSMIGEIITREPKKRQKKSLDKHITVYYSI
jgi:hypothetical protein